MHLLEIIKQNNPSLLRDTGLSPYAIGKLISKHTGNHCYANAFTSDKRHRKGWRCIGIDCTYCPFHQSRSKETVLEWLKHGYTVNDPKPKYYE